MSTRIYAKCDGSTSFRDRRDVQSSSSAFAVRTIYPKTMSEKKKREEKLSLSLDVEDLFKGGHARIIALARATRPLRAQKKSTRDAKRVFPVRFESSREDRLTRHFSPARFSDSRVRM